MTTTADDGNSRRRPGVEIAGNQAPREWRMPGDSRGAPPASAQPGCDSSTDAPTLWPAHTQENFSASDALYGALMENTVDGILIVSPDGIIRSFNRGAERLFGYSAGEAVSQPVSFLLPDVERELGRPGRAVQITAQRKDLRTFPVELTVTEAQVGQAFTAVLIVRDISKPGRIQAALEKQAAILRAQARLLNLAHDPILVREFGTNTVLFWNEGAEHTYGWTKGEALGKASDALLRPHLPRALAEIEAELLRDERWEGEIVHTRRDGTPIVVGSRWALQRDETGRPASVLEIHTDITERKRVEAERAALLLAEQEQSRRLRELAVLKADFSAMVAHELGAPLAAIIRLADILSTGELSPDEGAHAVATLKAEAVALNALVADIRTASRVERDDFMVEPRPAPLGELLAAAAAFAATLPGDHPLVTGGDHGATVWADPERVGQVLRNLLSNAAKYSPVGAPIELRATRNEGCVQIEVADSGYGIHPQDLARIFEKFGRGRDEAGRRIAGVGLGLYLSRRILRAHGSNLEVASELGTGSTFAFQLAVVS